MERLLYLLRGLFQTFRIVCLESSSLQLGRISVLSHCLTSFNLLPFGVFKLSQFTKVSIYLSKVECYQRQQAAACHSRSR